MGHICDVDMMIINYKNMLVVVFGGGGLMTGAKVNTLV